jgi:hypothetical protein
MISSRERGGKRSSEVLLETGIIFILDDELQVNISKMMF